MSFLTITGLIIIGFIAGLYGLVGAGGIVIIPLLIMLLDSPTSGARDSIICYVTSNRIVLL